MTHLTGYVGTYASPGAAGTYRFQLDAESGRLSEPELIYPQTNTKYAVWANGLLATVTENSQGCGLALLDPSAPGVPVLDEAQLKAVLDTGEPPVI